MPKKRIGGKNKWLNKKPPNTSWEPNSQVTSSRTFWAAQEDPKYMSELENREKLAPGSMSNHWGIGKPRGPFKGGV